MSNLNSSGSRERFTLAPLGNRQFFTDLGSNYAQIEVKGDDQAAGNVAIKLQTSEDGVSWTDVGSAVTVVPCGAGFLNGAVGKYAQIIMTSGTDNALVVAQFRNICQVTPKL